MDFYVIPPLSASKLMNEADRFFCLAHLYVNEENEAYRTFFQEKVKEGAWVTLDNGAAESSLVTPEVLLEVCKELMPSEVIAPDVIGDGAQTMTNATRFYGMLQGAGLEEKIELFFCPQGKDYEEWLMAYKWALTEKYITTIGWSKIAIPAIMNNASNDELIMESRHQLCEKLEELGTQHNDDAQFYFPKPIHLLGAGDPREFSFYSDRPAFRSNDSCFSIWAAMNGFKWDEEQYDRVKTPHDYFDRSLSRATSALAKKNIAALKNLS